MLEVLKEYGPRSETEARIMSLEKNSQTTRVQGA